MYVNAATPELFATISWPKFRAADATEGYPAAMRLAAFYVTPPPDWIISR